MLPVLSHIEHFKDCDFWVTTESNVGIGFEILPCDIETEDASEFGQRLIQVLRQLDHRILARVQMQASEAFDLEDEYPRAKALNSLGFTNKKVFLYLDFLGGFHAINEIKKAFSKKTQTNQEHFKILLQVRSTFEQYNFNLKVLLKEKLESLFCRGNSDWIRSERSVETGSRSIGVIRILKQPLESFSASDWVNILDKLPKPYSVNVSFQKIEEARAKLLLERKLKQQRSAKDIASRVQGAATEEAILQSFQTGSQLFEIEILITLERSSQEVLSKDLAKAISDLSMFSDSWIETYGVAPSLISTLPGSQQHVTILEADQALAALLPLWVMGEARNQEITAKRSLTLLRTDQSLFHFDLFNPAYNVFNSLIVGTSGKGKSVLTGLLTTSLLSDSNLMVIKLDVGGSHSKECELYGGEEFQLTLDRSSGINPFEVLKIKNASDNDKLGILSKFLTSLISEQGEVVLSKSLRGEIESSVRSYIDLNPSEPSLHNFYELSLSFPRRDLLKRWVKGGVYEAAFASKEEDQRDGTNRVLSSPAPSAPRPFASELVQFRAAGAPLSSRLRYYNFSQIFQAADPEFAQAGIASVLAQFNIEMLKANGKRIVLICDETPFFIKSCFDFFKFTTANVRKFGHAVVLISQLSTDFIVNGDTGIIENSPQRFIFSSDGDDERFKERFSLSQSDLNKIKDLRSIVGSFSEVLFQTEETSRKLTVKVTPEEYWRLTTSRVDKEKLYTLLENVPGLSLREAIACLSCV